MIDNAINEYQVNKDGSMKVKCKKITGKIARINEHLKHQDSNYFNAFAVCSETKDCSVKYKLSMRNKIDDDKAFYVFIFCQMWRAQA